MTRLLDPTDRATVRSYEDTVLLSDLADQLLTEAGICDDIRTGSWLFLARLGEGTPVADREIENRLWTAVADIDFDARPPALPTQANPGVVVPHTKAAFLHGKNADALERIAAFDGAGIAICLDRTNPRNDDLIRSLTCLLEPRHPDDDGPIAWYGDPPGPFAAGGAS